MSDYQYLSPWVIGANGPTPEQQRIIDDANAQRAQGMVFNGVSGYVPADQYNWRDKFGGAGNSWGGVYGLSLDPGAFASENDFMAAYNAGILANQPKVLGGVEQRADGSLFIGRDGGMKDDGYYYSGDLGDNGNVMGRFQLTPDTKVRLTGKDGEVLYQGQGTSAGPELMDALSFGVNKTGKSHYNVQTMDANGNWNTVVKGDPGPGLLGNFLTAMAITGGAILGGHFLLPLLGGGAAGGAAAGTAAAAGAGGAVGASSLGGALAASGAGLSAGAIGAGAGLAGGLGAGLSGGAGAGAGLGSGLATVLGDTLVVTGAAGGGIGAGALGALGAGALAGGAAAAGGLGGASSGTGAAGSGNAVIDPATGDLVVTGATPTSGLGALGATGAATGAAVGGAAAAGSGTGSTPGDAPGGDIVVNGGQGAPVGGLTAGGVAAGAGAAAAGSGAANAANAAPKSTLDKILDYLQLGALGTGLLGNVLGGSGSGSGNGTIPGGLGSGSNPIFNAPLPTANIPGGVGSPANLGPRTMPDQDWNKYAMHPEQSFFKYVPQNPAPGGLSSLGN